MKISIEKKSLVGFGLATVVLVGINALSYWSFNKNREIANWVAHTQQMRQNIQSTLADIESAEAGQRAMYPRCPASADSISARVD
jgi:CHASE3 domain sensor protein